MRNSKEQVLAAYIPHCGMGSLSVKATLRTLPPSQFLRWAFDRVLVCKGPLRTRQCALKTRRRSAAFPRR